MIYLDIKITKDIPEKQINTFKDKVVYNTASLTREYVKGVGGFPRLTGKLEQEEIKTPITKTGNYEYGLLAGVDYAKYVWKMNNVKWTNKSTIQQWYQTAFDRKGATILNNAIERAKKEL
jgi:hypothetical protein